MSRFISWWECGSMSASLWSGLPLSLGFCIRDVLPKWTWWMWKSSINPEWLWQWIPFPLQLTVSTMVMCFEFQQTEVYQFTAKPSMKPKQVWNPQGCFSLGSLSQGPGWPLSGDWTGVFRLSTERVLCLRLQCRPAHSTLPACLHPDLEGPAKGEKAIRSPCPSHACLVGQTGHACCGWSRGFQGSWESSPVMEANPCQLAVYPLSIPHLSPWNSDT